MKQAGRFVAAVLLVAALTAGAGDAAAQERLGDGAVKARQRFFGAANVNGTTGAVRADRVILSWASVSTFAAALNGHVVLLDGFVAQGAAANYVPLTPQQLADLRPEAIFIGHAHYDHALDAGDIAAATGATVVGLPQHCAAIRARTQAPIRCLEAMAQDVPLGTTREVSLIPGVPISALRHKHSPGLSVSSLEPGPFRPDFDDGRRPCPPHLPYEEAAKHPPSVDQGLQEALGAGSMANEGGVLLYQFRIGGFALSFNDSAASLVDAPPELERGMRALPPSTVHLGSLASLNQGNACLRDPRLYMEALRAKVFVPQHHDYWAPFPLAGPGSYYEAELRVEMERIPAARRPCLRFLADPADYVRPDKLTFDLADGDHCRAGIQAVPGCRDRRRPTSLFDLRSTRVTRRSLRLAGRSSDRGCAAPAPLSQRGGVRGVEVAVARRMDARARRCRHLRPSGTLTPTQACSRRIWLAALGTGSWRFARSLNLPPGSYELRIRARDRAGNREIQRARGNRLRVWVR
jgi:hypothetical protein